MNMNRRIEQILVKFLRHINLRAMTKAFAASIYNVPIVMDSLVGSIESDMGIKAT